MYVVNAQRTIQFFRWITHLSYLKSKRFKIKREKKIFFFFFFERFLKKHPLLSKNFHNYWTSRPSNSSLLFSLGQIRLETSLSLLVRLNIVWSSMISDNVGNHFPEIFMIINESYFWLTKYIAAKQRHPIRVEAGLPDCAMFSQPLVTQPFLPDWVIRWI